MLLLDTITVQAQHLISSTRRRDNQSVYLEYGAQLEKRYILEYGAQLDKRCIKVKEAANPDFTVNSTLLTRGMEFHFFTRNVIKQLIDD